MINESSIIFRPKRGEIYLCNLGKYSDSEKDGFCPVMVIQADELSSKTATVVVAPLTTSEPKKSGIPCHVYLPVEECLTKASTVLLERMKTVDFIAAVLRTRKHGNRSTLELSRHSVLAPGRKQNRNCQSQAKKQHAFVKTAPVITKTILSIE